MTTPIFATSKSRLKYSGPYQATDGVEDKMMKVRWNVFEFKHVFKEEEKIECDPCAKCFSQLVFS